MLELGFALVRVSAYWDEIRKGGYAELDRLLDMARAAGQSMILTVGMKAIQWPEFYIPADVHPDAHLGGRIGLDPEFANEVLAFVTATVERYRDRPEIAAWQVENEPFNRTGPKRWWIDQGLVRREFRTVRALDARPIVLNALAHFDPIVDFVSRPRRGPFDIRRLEPERAMMDLLGTSDVLGLDVYTDITVHFMGRRVVRKAARDWAESAGRWLRAAAASGCDAWIIESQAEPWESPLSELAKPRSFGPRDLVGVHGELVRAGYSAILLWGCEYWFWRAEAGDGRWLDAARQVIEACRR